MDCKINVSIKELEKSVKDQLREYSELLSKEYIRRTRIKSDQALRLSRLETSITLIQTLFKSLKDSIDDIKEAFPNMIESFKVKTLAVMENMKTENDVEEQRKANLEIIKQGQVKTSKKNVAGLENILMGRKSISRPSTIQSYNTLTRNKNSMTTMKLRRKYSKGDIQYKRYSNPATKYYAFEDRSNTKSKKVIVNNSNFI